MKIDTLRVEDICDFVGGSQPAKSEFINEPKTGYVRLIQTRDYKTDSYPTYIPENSTRKFCDEDDIMIGRYGPPVFQICSGLKGAYNVALLKAKPKAGVDREFLYYFLKQKSVFQYVDKLSARTGGQTGVDLVSLNKYPVRIPNDITDQRTLVNSLVAIDKKIELNNRINAELEAMTKTLYDYWFVQFDFPDANGKPYKTSGGKLKYSELLKQYIPEHWNECQLRDLVLFEYGKPLKASIRSGSGYPVFGSSGVIGFHDSFLVKGPGIVVGRKGTVGKVNYVFDDFFPIDTTYYAKANKDYSLIYINYLLCSLGLETMNSDSAVPGLNRESALRLQTVQPPSILVEKYHNLVSVWFNKKKQILQESDELVSLRDWLLPMLMNGQVKVKPSTEPKNV